MNPNMSPECRLASACFATVRSTIFVTFLIAGDAMPEIAPCEPRHERKVTSSALRWPTPSFIAACRYPEPILRWTSEIYADALSRCGVEGFATHANDYCIADRKFGGNAQSISGRRYAPRKLGPSGAAGLRRRMSLVRWLHHTSLLWEYERARMALLRMPAKRPAYRADRLHDDFIRGLAEAGVPDKSEFVAALIAAAAERLELHDAKVEDALLSLDKPHRKTTRPVDLDHIDR